MALDRWPKGEVAFKAWLSENASQVLKHIGIVRGQTVLDYGCGCGTFTIPAARIVGSTGRVYALDISEKALNALRRKSGETNIEIVLINETEDPLSTLRERADVILLFDVLHLIDDKSSLLSELHSVLKADGVLSIFPMHLGVEETLRVMGQLDLFALSGRRGMLLSFHCSC